MDFNLKHWRDEPTEDQETAAKLPRLLLSSYDLNHHSSTAAAASSALPLFVQCEPPNSNLSAHSSDNSTPLSAASKLPRMGSSCFSVGQWQELELQALIFRHITAGAAVPPQLLHLLNKSLAVGSTPQYYLCNPLHQCYSHYQPAALLQSGYWGRAAMDPEPGRCRRTDGKKWRCSRDVVAGQKYCERHMHRGRNRSRKPVETPTSAAAANNGGGETFLKALHSTTQGMATAVAGGAPPFKLSGPSPSMDLLNTNRRASSSIIQFDTETEGQTASGRTLRHFFDDWPRSEDDAGGCSASATKLTMSMPSDFSLKLGTGSVEDSRAQIASGERDGPRLNWGTPWEATNRAAPMGGPLAEALRSSTSTSSPTSVLHRLPLKSSASETSYVSS
ncbi:growth-regulating factor 3-like [Andrographis paniculata]|uniref:growth-regulating factor 3-like n=1 Tax=Andrographis paniculata TaxID=175694 RepID=UPI0021E92425|nr:growth-regulating factor 3-like [Andrographis paniculata]